MKTRIFLIASLIQILGVAARDSAHAQERRLAHRTPAMDQVRVIENLVYSRITGSPDTVMYGDSLLYDVFLPASGGGRRAGVVFIHGGLVAGSAQRVSPKDVLPAYEQWGRLVAASGLVAITFSHRLNTNENVDTAAADVLNMMREIRRRATEWNLDPDRTCVAAFSAGGPLTSLFMSDSAAAAHGVRCIALFYPFMDLEHAAVISPFRQPHAEPRLSLLREYSPVARLLRGARVPPLFLARAGQDAIPGINASIDRFMDAALLTNRAVEFVNHPTGQHGFDMTAEPDARAEYILESALRFFLQHLDSA